MLVFFPVFSPSFSRTWQTLHFRHEQRRCVEAVGQRVRLPHLKELKGSKPFYQIPKYLLSRYVNSLHQFQIRKGSDPFLFLLFSSCPNYFRAPFNCFGWGAFSLCPRELMFPLIGFGWGAFFRPARRVTFVKRCKTLCFKECKKSLKSFRAIHYYIKKCVEDFHQWLIISFYV
ncbi:hypothetical protein Mar181_1324 [Marinomonas posidonica IVIA-Po-181]|uniref:Uncharacterized protein n=1 Tax=Marinomonas posidonica (strain CECT 7376 / NCIMB 14433 / IVIA-Po-181) TaxID=491952 RepID=F6CWL8_MARPP|nr:hypothetical protein Mar181_1324 [Marinomonas posidonica IVIA-Po-181]